MIRIADPGRLGPALAEVRQLLGISRHELATRIADRTGRSQRGVYNQLVAWDRALKAPTATSLPDVLTELGYDLALIPREDRP